MKTVNVSSTPARTTKRDKGFVTFIVQTGVFDQWNLCTSP